MTHGLGVGGAVEAALAPLEPLFVLLTLLGNPAVLVLLGAGAYWAGTTLPWVPRGLDAGKAVVLLALVVGALGLGTGLKVVIGVPRPPGAGTATAPGWLPDLLAGAYEWAASADGMAVPSGHILGATVAYGGLAVLPGRSGRARRLALAAPLVVAVAVSRLALGVHVLPDVVAGAALGGALLAVVVAAARRPEPALGVGLGLTLAGAALAGLSPEAGAYLGAGLGAGLAWLIALDRRPAAPGPAWVAAVGALTVTPLLAVSEFVEGPALALAAGAAAGAWALVLPVLAAEKPWV